MNRRMVLYMLGRIVRMEAALLLLPLAVSLYYREDCAAAFLITIGVALCVGTLMVVLSRPGNQVIFAKEGFVIVALAWLGVSAVGALPFFISRGIPSYVDAFFETVSGFTTTGSSILRDVEALPRGLLFWRSETHWIGGMGVLVLIMALVPSVSGRTMHILKAEMPGPIVGKLVPRVRDTAKILYLIYIAMTLVQVILLLCGGMSLFDSVVHTFGTAGTGGFGIYRNSIAGFSPYIQWVIAVFMLLFGINFNLYYLILVRRVREALCSRELWCYLLLVLLSSAVITVNIFPHYRSAGEAIRTAVFQVSSIITTTGYATTDFNLWPGLSKVILFLLMFVGGCAGSTAGGLKVSRVMLLCKSVRRDLQRQLHPRSVGSIQLEGRRVDNVTVAGVGIYLTVYCLLLAATLLLLSFEPFGLECNLSAAVTCLNNVGPGFGMVGPAGSFAEYSAFSQVVLSLAMLFGRLEICPLLFVLTPTTWMKK